MSDTQTRRRKRPFCAVLIGGVLSSLAVGPRVSEASLGFFRERSSSSGSGDRVPVTPAQSLPAVLPPLSIPTMGDETTHDLGLGIRAAQASSIGINAAAGFACSGAASDAAVIKESHDQIYDRSAKLGAAAPAGEAVVTGDYTQSPPNLSLPQLKPQWKSSQGPSAPDLKFRFDAKGMVELGSVGALAVTETLKPEPVTGLFRDITPNHDVLSYGKRLYLEVKTGIKQGRLVGSQLAWTDAEGRFNLYDPKADALVRISAPGGPIERFVTSPHSRTVYVIAAGTLQRWDLETNTAQVIRDEKVTGLGLHDLAALRSSEDGVEVKTGKGSIFWTHNTLSLHEGGPEEVYADQGVVPNLRSAGEFYIETVSGGSRIWRNTLGGSGAAVRDIGALPFEVKTVQATMGRDTLFAVTEQGLLEWDMEARRYRLFEITGLKESVLGRHVTLDLSLNGQQAAIAAGDRLFYVDFGDSTREAEAAESRIRDWSDENPMYIKDGVLHIGEFTFLVQERKAKPARRSWLEGLWGRISRRRPETSAPRGPLLSEQEWRAVNLPSNKWAIYQTLKGFTLGQHALYIGETGGGKTWMAERIAKLIGRKLYMVSFTEYTKNQDLLFARTFGEEKANQTGKTFETVLEWLSDPEGGILLLDEMHKPLEGIAALNNILQNWEYHLKGIDIKGSPKTHFVIGDMNPVKPPYKGEPPSGELSSRFGVTLEINYLPRGEEAALLGIFYPKLKAEVAKRLVAIANDLRRVYPDLLPLPVSPRTLLQIAAKLVAFPKDDPIEAFRTTYNPSTLVQDSSISEAIEKALVARDLAGAVAGPGQKKN